MNEKIKALAKEAGIHFEEGKQSRTHYVSTGTLDKFAELIIKESARFMDEYADRTGRDLLEHFEVE